MPRKKASRQRTGVIQWSLPLDLALTSGPNPAAQPGDDDYFSDAELRDGWSLYGVRIMRDAARHGARLPWGYWRHTDGITDELRGERPQRHELPDDPAEARKAAQQRAKARADLETRRRRWINSLRTT